MKTHPSITPKAAKLLQRVAKRILKHHEEYDQSYYSPACGFGCCIAGHAYLISHKDQNPWQCQVIDFMPSFIAADSNLVLMPSDWMEPFASAYAEAKTSKGRARVGYRRIMHYLRTGE